MKNKIILPIAIFTVSLLIVPHITFASWWNPFTWKSIKKSEVKNERVIIATSTSDNRAVRMEKATTTEKIEQKKEETKKPKTTDNFTDTNVQKRDAEKEIEKLKKEVEELKKKQANNQQSVVSAQTPVTTPAIQSTENSYLKVERCKAERDKKRAEMEALVTPMTENLFNDCFNSVITEANKLKEKDEQTGGTEALTRFQLGTLFCKSRKEPNSAAFRVEFDQLANEGYYVCINK